MQRPQAWWAGLDSNQRSAFARQIYSLVQLTALPSALNITLAGTKLPEGIEPTT